MNSSTSVAASLVTTPLGLRLEAPRPYRAVSQRRALSFVHIYLGIYHHSLTKWLIAMRRAKIYSLCMFAGMWHTSCVRRSEKESFPCERRHCGVHVCMSVATLLVENMFDLQHIDKQIGFHCESAGCMRLSFSACSSINVSSCLL